MSNQGYWDEIREKRNRYLLASDWTQMPDSPLSDEKKAEWRTYRQALRDMVNVDLPDGQTESEVNPLTFLSFPVKPSG